LAILASDSENDLRFWTHCSAQFKSNPDVFFAPAGDARQALVDAIRSSGAKQPVLVGGPVRDANVIIEVTPRYASTRTGEDRWRSSGPSRSSLPCW